MKEINEKKRKSQKQPAKHWRVTSAALAAAFMASGLSFSAQALVLGQIRVHSALGEPLRAEVPITQLTSDETSSLQIALANPNDFGGRGLIYNSVLASMRVNYEITGKSTAVIKLTSMRPIQDPFIDVLMDVRWRAGSLQRSYTMLIDPPKEVTDNITTTPSASATSSVPSRNTSPRNASARTGISERIISPSESSVSNSGTKPSQTGAASNSDVKPPQSNATINNAVKPPPKSEVKPADTKPATQGNTNNAFTVTVQRGQTLGQIAASLKPSGVSTEQMLAALYQANPSAFINSNLNWMRTGVTLRVPSDSEIKAIAQRDARRLVSSHARAFNQHRTRVAEQTTSVQSENDKGGRTSTGTIGNATQIPAPQVTNEFHITSGSSSQTDIQSRDDAALAAQQQEAEDQARQREIEENNRGLAEINSGIATNFNSDNSTNTNTNPEDGNNGMMPTLPPTDTTQTPIDTQTNSTEISSQTSVDATRPPALEARPSIEEPSVATPPVDKPPVATPPVAKPPVATPPVAKPPVTSVQGESSFIDTLMENPLIPIGGLVALLLLAFGGYKFMKSRRPKDDDSEFDEDDALLDSTPDSFFADNPSNANGGESMLDQSSSIYAASQLDTNADVDPVQEADVYLAYGRDEQAAEILRDALETEPERSALHAKLCEVYARQNNVQAFDEQAAQLRALTLGEGPEWIRIAKLGQNISPNNELFADVVKTRSLSGVSSHFVTSPEPSSESVMSAASATSTSQTPVASSELQQVSTAESSASELGFLPTGHLNALQQNDEPKEEYDFSDVSMELTNSRLPSEFGVSDNEPSSFIPDDEEGPATRLALAEEFLAIGNKNDAKEIVEEVLKEAISEEVKRKASSLLDQAS